MKLCQGSFRLDIKIRFFTERVVRHWNRPHSENVTAPSLLEFKKHLDSTLRHMIRFLGGPVWSQELDPMILVGPFPLGIFYDSNFVL